MNQHHHSYHVMLPLHKLKYWCGWSLGPFNSRSLLKNICCAYWYTDGYFSSVGPSSAWTWKMQHQEWEELLTHFILNLLMAWTFVSNSQNNGVMHVVCKLLFRARYVVQEPWMSKVSCMLSYRLIFQVHALNTFARATRFNIFIWN